MFRLQTRSSSWLTDLAVQGTSVCQMAEKWFYYKKSRSTWNPAIIWKHWPVISSLGTWIRATYSWETQREMKSSLLFLSSFRVQTQSLMYFLYGHPFILLMMNRWVLLAIRWWKLICTSGSSEDCRVCVLACQQCVIKVCVTGGVYVWSVTWA